MDLERVEIGFVCSNGGGCGAGGWRELRIEGGVRKEKTASVFWEQQKPFWSVCSRVYFLGRNIRLPAARRSRVAGSGMLIISIVISLM